MYILIAILAFCFLIVSHELGHFLAARACGVRVLEFSLGMGPLLWKKQGPETQYSLRLLPIGGFCAMEGEDEASDDPRAFSSQSRIKRAIILVAGAAMNFAVGFLMILLLFFQASGFWAPVVTDFAEGCPYEGEEGLLEGDRILRVNGHRIYFISNISLYASRSPQPGVVDIEIERGGERLLLEDFPLVPVEYTQEDGSVVRQYGFLFGQLDSGPLAKLQYSWYRAIDFVRLVWVGLTDLVSGTIGVQELSGVVGIVGVINETGEAAPTVRIALEDIGHLVAFIAVNLAVMNLLPFPALDGGRVIGLLLTAAIEAVTRRRLDPKYEGYVHTAGLALLMGLMLVIAYNDIVRLVRG